MSIRPLDTSEQAWRIVNEGIRRMTPAQRIGRVVSLTILAHGVALAQIRRDHPDEDDRRWRLRLAARLYGAELIKRAFDWPPG